MWQSLQQKKHFFFHWKMLRLGTSRMTVWEAHFLASETGEKFKSTYLKSLETVLRVQTNGEVFIQGNLVNASKDLESVAFVLQSTAALPSKPV